MIEVEERIKKNFMNRHINNEKLQEVRKKLGLSKHWNGKRKLLKLLFKVKKREVALKDAFEYITRERADADYQGEIRGLSLWKMWKDKKEIGGMKE